MLGVPFGFPLKPKILWYAENSKTQKYLGGKNKKHSPESPGVRYRPLPPKARPRLEDGPLLADSKQ